MLIDIDIDYAEIVRRKARWDKAMTFEFPDRVPVLHYLGARFWLPHVGAGKGFREYLNDPRFMLEAQLRAGKWILENVDSDYHQIVCYPDFLWAEDSESFGARFVYPEDDSPWLARPHFLQENNDLKVKESRLCTRRHAWKDAGVLPANEGYSQRVHGPVQGWNDP